MMPDHFPNHEGKKPFCKIGVELGNGREMPETSDLLSAQEIAQQKHP
jgi:hypothetical protein